MVQITMGKQWDKKFRTWSLEQIHFLEEEYLHKGNTEISHILGKTEVAVRVQIHRLGLKRPLELVNKLKGVSGTMKKGIQQNPESVEKMRATIKAQYASGRVTWSKGKTLDYMKGEKNPLWNNGSSFEPYGKRFNESFKKAIRERDGCCMLCNIGFDDLHLLKRRVHVHHINYLKTAVFLQNCLALCNNCHSKTNANRHSWTIFFQDLLKERYGYQYTEDQKILLDFTEDKYV